MLFTAKTKGFFVEQNDHSLLLARTSASATSLVIEQLAECALGDSAALEQAIKRLQPKKAQSGYLNAVCGIYPSHRLVRRATLEPKRLKEPAYLTEVLSTQFRVEADKHEIYILNSQDGTDFDPTKPTQKEVIFCGIPSEEIVAAQDALLALGIYPEKLELGSVAMLGSVVDHLAFKKSKTSTLILEIGAEVTHSFIVTAGGIEASRLIPQGLESMVPVVQKELGLKDAESARKLFFSNTFDFTGMGPLLVKRLLKELQSSIGFYEVQTGQSVGQLICTSLPPKLAWLETAIATSLGVTGLQLDLAPWLQSRQVIVPDGVAAGGLDARWFGLLSLMINHTASDAIAAEKKD